MTSWRSRALPLLLAATGRHRAYLDAESARAHIDNRGGQQQPFWPPPRLRRDVEVAFEHGSGWPVYTLTPKANRKAAPESVGDGCPGRTVFYLHGGAWVNEITGAHWRLAAQIAAEADAEVIVPIYPLVPHTTAAEVMPVIVDMVIAALTRAQAQARARAQPEVHRVCLAGDSAGGQMVLSAALMLRDRHDVILPETVLISPVLDLSLANPLIGSVDDPWLGRDALRVFADRWRGDLDLSDLRVNPIAAALAGLGPLTVFSGTRDILNPDARLFTEKARAAGVPVDYHEQPGLLHVYPLTPTPEGRAARAAIVDQLRRA
ncbi:alpha/beta hydrolase fold domain-containing protein [Mycobacterium sp.]|uniref:alpha/beta hydrolase fold domain-containing protein n=1 Tax=Mycobacterium sp. TaxID=1785 RepID=UPI003A885BC3